jgi:8-oxo-dGTP pyrophosphatase MutT (NUDIX family)
VAQDPCVAAIAQLLNTYRPSDAQEAERLEAMHQLLRTPAPRSREQIAPGHFTASAFLIAPAHRQTLLIEHPTLGLWLQPGGHFEPADESAVAAARREVQEETGLIDMTIDDKLFDIDVHQIPARGHVPAHRHFDLRFLIRLDALAVPRSAENVRTRWLTLAELEVEPMDHSVRRMGRKALGS